MDVTGDNYDSDAIMRLAMSGLYNVGNLSWQTASSYIHSTPMPSKEYIKGGCIEILDLNALVTQSTQSTQSSHANGSTGLSIASTPIKFLAHSTNLSFIKFSYSGLKMASSDVNGQVIHVHGLSISCTTGLTTGVIGEGDKNKSNVMLLYKLHRG